MIIKQVKGNNLWEKEVKRWREVFDLENGYLEFDKLHQLYPDATWFIIKGRKGIGKTYQINKIIENANENNRFFYVRNRYLEIQIWQGMMQSLGYKLKGQRIWKDKTEIGMYANMDRLLNFRSMVPKHYNYLIWDEYNSPPSTLTYENIKHADNWSCDRYFETLLTFMHDLFRESTQRPYIYMLSNTYLYDIARAYFKIVGDFAYVKEHRLVYVDFKYLFKQKTSEYDDLKEIYNFDEGVTKWVQTNAPRLATYVVVREDVPDVELLYRFFWGNNHEYGFFKVVEEKENEPIYYLLDLHLFIDDYRHVKHTKEWRETPTYTTYLPHLVEFPEITGLRYKNDEAWCELGHQLRHLFLQRLLVSNSQTIANYFMESPRFSEILNPKLA